MQAEEPDRPWVASAQGAAPGHCDPPLLPEVCSVLFGDLTFGLTSPFNEGSEGGSTLRALSSKLRHKDSRIVLCCQRLKADLPGEGVSGLQGIPDLCINALAGICFLL